MLNVNVREISLLTNLGSRLKKARLAKNESQELFAQRLDISRQTYAKMEKGSPTVPIGYWLKASSILGLLKTWEDVLQEQEDLFARYEIEQSARKRASGRRERKS